MNSYRIRIRQSFGFSLVEIAIVLLILAILLTLVGIPLATQINQQRTLDTQKQLEQIKEALDGYAMANGRLPCPAISTSNGAEAFATGGSATDGNCSAFVGFVPAATLGLSPVDANGFLVDSWGLTQNRIRYAVRGLLIAGCITQLNPLTRTDGIKTASMGCLSNDSGNTTMLTVCSTTPSGLAGAATGCAPSASTLTEKAPFILISVGKNAPAGAAAGSDELHNVDTDYFFVSHDQTAVGSPAGEFDDIVTWGNLNTLFARMVQAGRLP